MPRVPGVYKKAAKREVGEGMESELENECLLFSSQKKFRHV